MAASKAPLVVIGGLLALTVAVVLANKKDGAPPVTGPILVAAGAPTIT